MSRRRANARRHRRGPVLVVLGLALAAASPAADAGTDAGAATCEGRRATIIGTDGPDEIIGTRGPDVIVALGGDDLVQGRGGDDLVCGGDGADHLRGGSGDDRLLGEGDGELTGDVLVDGPGDDHYVGGADDKSDRLHHRRAESGITADLQAETVVGESSGSDTHAEIDILRASRHDDRITGSTSPDLVWALAGDDVIDGNGGESDTAYGGPGADMITDVDFQHGDRGADTMQGGTVVMGGPGDDHLLGSAIGDELQGGPGDDLLEGFGGQDRLAGNEGDDVLDGGTDRDRGDGSVGVDTCISIEVRRGCDDPGGAGAEAGAPAQPRKG